MSSNRSGVSGELLEIKKLLSPDEIISEDSSDYIANSLPWSISKDKRPRLVVRPRSIASLSSIVAYLSNTELDYKVRSQGCGSASATDVLISLSAFDEFEFNEKEEYVMLGAGNDWGSYYERMEAVAPKWSIVPVRTPTLGVGGSTLGGGWSWLSGEYGCASDPNNLLDAHVVLANGKAMWASSDPDLLWSIRGTGGSFAIATHFKFRARQYPQNGNIWSGNILVPRTKLRELAKGFMKLAEKDRQGLLSPKVSLYFIDASNAMLKEMGLTERMIVVLVFDAEGEEHGRNTFEWALNIEGALDFTKANMTLRDVSMLQAPLGKLKGQTEAYWSPICLFNSGEFAITEDIIVNAFDWSLDLQSEEQTIADNTMTFFELLSSSDNATGRGSSGWPRPNDSRHMLLLLSGCGPNSSKETSDKARKAIIDAHKMILGKSPDEVTSMPHCVEFYHNIPKMYGEHYEKLRKIKTKIDPHNRIRGVIQPFKR